MRTLGIDPGATGALVLLEDGQPIEWTEMPTTQIGTHIYVEQVHAMPGQGVVSMFNFGHSCGTVMGVLGALGIPHTMVTPQAWKKSAGLIGTDKDAARARAIQLWPKWRELDKKGKGQALADAALIARLGGAK
jgi:crossover junction endodeoxyribonuclease RuvC